MWEIARRPRWIGGLVVALAIAAIFALLSQWQIARSVDEGTVLVRQTEVAVPLGQLEQPQGPVTTRGAGQRVSVVATMVDDFLLLPGRLNGGKRGYWIVGHLIQSGGDVSVATAIGWSPNADAAARALEQLSTNTDLVPKTFTGRYLPSEAPQEDDFENGVQNAMSVAAFVNQWKIEPDRVYGGYLILDARSLGSLTQLTVIDSPAPSAQVQVNWLNVFYAIEWVVFALFAVFLWFRLVRDTYQRELEEAAELN
jgi:cytochrome oxidase assembly protein ShyY1